MTPPFPPFKELQRLLDALCEEVLTAGQMRRLEELLLGHPEAVTFYVHFMATYAGLASLDGRRRRLRSRRDDGTEPSRLGPRCRPS